MMVMVMVRVMEVLLRRIGFLNFPASIASNTSITTSSSSFAATCRH